MIVILLPINVFLNNKTILMKRVIHTVCLLLCIISEVNACDICGCGVGNNYLGILPEFSRKIVGVRYRYSALLTHVGVGGATTYLTTNEQYRTVEAWGGWNISNRFRVMASVPYSFNERVNQGDTRSKNGIGDITVSGFYQLINKRHTINGHQLLVQSLWIGGGVKLPTGKYNPKDKSSQAQTNLFQLGTGSVDFMFNAMYDVRLQDAGLNLAASYKMNTANKYDYTYGNKLSSSAQAYYKFRIKNVLTVAPNAGVLCETAAHDVDQKFPVDISGGHVLMATAGMEAIFKKIAIGGNWQPPLSQKLANGIVKAKQRMMLHVSVML